MKTKLCLIIRPAHYREEFCRRIDREYDCSWNFFEDTVNTGANIVKSFDLQQFRDSNLLHNITFIHRPLFWTKGMLRLLFNHNTFLINGTIHCTTLWLILVLAKFFPKKKINLWSIAFDGRESWFERKLKRLFFGLADSVFVYNDKGKSLMVKEGIDALRVHVIHNSLSLSKQISIRNKIKLTDIYSKHFGNNYKTIILIGRLIERKCPDITLRAIRLLKDKKQYFNLVYVGDGDMKMPLEKLAIELGIETQVWFYGPCYNEEINAELLYNADLCMSPGIVGLTSIHAMTYGTPVISRTNKAYQAPEADSIIIGKTGAFIEDITSEAVAESITKWFSCHFNDRELIRKNCFDEIETNWSPDFQITVLKSNMVSYF